MPYIRTQLYVPQEIAQGILLLAKTEGKSRAEIYRELLATGLQKKTKKKTLTSAEGLLKIASLAKRGPKDLSSNLGSYLYGNKSPNFGKE